MSLTTSRLQTAAEYAERRGDEASFDVSLIVQPLGVMVDVVEPDSSMADQRLVSWVEIDEASSINMLCRTIDDLIANFPKPN